MDIPTLTVIIIFCLILGLVIYLRFSNVVQSSKLTYITFFSLIVWLFVSIFGEFFTKLGINSICYKYMGCDEGFFGYDAVEHFLAGIAFAFLILWACREFPQYSILHSKYWKNALTVIAYVTLLAVFWEIGELIHDFLRVTILHQNLFSFRLHINYLDQPSNMDTMGDISLNLIGAIISLLIVRFIHPGSLKNNEDSLKLA